MFALGIPQVWDLALGLCDPREALPGSPPQPAKVPLEGDIKLGEKQGKQTKCECLPFTPQCLNRGLIINYRYGLLAHRSIDCAARRTDPIVLNNVQLHGSTQRGYKGFPRKSADAEALKIMNTENISLFPLN